TVADARVLVRLAVLLELHRRRRDHAGAADDVQVLELVHGVRLRRLIGDDGDQVLVVDLFLAVGEVLESLERAVEIAGGEVEAEVLESRRQRVPPGVLAEDELVGRAPDVLGLPDLVGELLLEHAVLVNACLVGERVLADDGLVRLHVDAGDVREQPRGAEDLFRLHAGLGAEVVLASVQRHHDFFERGVAGPLADTVDGALHLPRAVHDARQRVGHRLAEIVVAVDGEHVRARVPLEPLLDPRDPLAPLAGDGVADRVGDVDRARAGVDTGLEDITHVVEVGAGGVLRRELDVLAVAARVPDRLYGRLHHLGPRLTQLVLQVDVGGRDERVDAGLRRVLHRLPAPVDVAQAHAREPADRRGARERADLLGHLARRLEVLLGRDGEAGLDDVHVQARQLPGHLQLFHRVHREPGRLLAVTERGVEDDDSVHGLLPLFFLACHGWSLLPVASIAAGAGVWPTISRRTGPETAYPPNTTKRNTSCFVATIIPA